MTVAKGQIRRWRGAMASSVMNWEQPMLVLEPKTVQIPQHDWSEDGWNVLFEGRVRWFSTYDLEEDSEPVEVASEEG